MRIIWGVVFSGPAAVVLIAIACIRSIIGFFSGEGSSYIQDPGPPPRPGGWARVQRITLRCVIGVPGFSLFLTGGALTLMEDLEPAMTGLAVKVMALALVYWVFLVWNTTRASGPSNYKAHHRVLGWCWLLLPALEYFNMVLILRYAGITPVLKNQEITLAVLAVGIVVGVVIASGIWKGKAWADGWASVLAFLYSLGMGWGMALAFYTWWVSARKRADLRL